MITLKGFYRFLSFYPCFFLLYYFVIVETNGKFWGMHKDMVLIPFFLGIGAAGTLLIPAWIYSSVVLLVKEPKEKTHWIFFALFLLPSLALFYFLKFDPFNFWGNVVD